MFLKKCVLCCGAGQGAGSHSPYLVGQGSTSPVRGAFWALLPQGACLSVAWAAMQLPCY